MYKKGGPLYILPCSLCKGTLPVYMKAVTNVPQ